MLTKYNSMWIIATFDCDVETKENKHEYKDLRKFLLKEGFIMFQYSIYLRNFQNISRAENFLNRTDKYLPKEAHVAFFIITDKQFEMTRNYYGKNMEVLPDKNPQVLII